MIAINLEVRVVQCVVDLFLFFFQFVAWTTARLNPKRAFMVTYSLFNDFISRIKLQIS